VLIVKSLPPLPAAIRTNAVDCQINTARLKPARHFQAGGRCRQVHIENRAALVAVKMAVLLHVWAESARAAAEMHLSDQAALYQCIEAIIDSRHRNVWHGALGPLKNLVRRRVVAPLQQHVIDMLALPREAEAARREPLVQRRAGGRLLGQFQGVTS